MTKAKFIILINFMIFILTYLCVAFIAGNINLFSKELGYFAGAYRFLVIFFSIGLSSAFTYKCFDEDLYVSFKKYLQSK